VAKEKLIGKIKGVIEYVGLLPTVAGYFKIAPQWLQPSPFYEPDSQYWAAGVSLVVFIGTSLYLNKVQGPVAQWTKDQTARHFRQACAAAVGAFLSMSAFVALVRTLEHASVGIDAVQMALWSAFFACLTFMFTAFAFVWKAP
jgi:hypothetical protein